MTETTAARGASVWPGVYAVDVMGKPHQVDDSYSRRELTWSPSVGSFEQEMPNMAAWLSDLPGVDKRGEAGFTAGFSPRLSEYEPARGVTARVNRACLRPAYLFYGFI